MNSRRLVLWALIVSMWGSGAVAGSPVPVFVSIEPQRYFVERIGGERVRVSVFVPPGADPHSYEPRPRQMAELSRAAVYFAIGIDFEKAWMEKIATANPRMPIVATDRGVEKIALPAHVHADGHRHRTAAKTSSRGRLHTHGADGGHGHVHDDGLDPHIWLSPALVRIQAAHIRDGLIAVDPDHRARYEAGYASFLEEIERLDAELRALFAGREGARFLVFHPSWGYFARDYGLEQRAIEVEGKEPKPARLEEVIRFARQEGIRAVFVQPQFSTRSAEAVARGIGGKVIPVDPLAADWAENLRRAAGRLREALP
ncbi:MAG: zinc ABC transporter substrate-binding protein [Desulfobacterales bacterium]